MSGIRRPYPTFLQPEHQSILAQKAVKGIAPHLKEHAKKCPAHHVELLTARTGRYPAYLAHIAYNNTTHGLLLHVPVFTTLIISLAAYPKQATKRLDFHLFHFMQLYDCLVSKFFLTSI
jgi:hypothetical protein